MHTTDANAMPCDAPTLSPIATRPTFHVSREMVCFVAGIAVTLGIVYICVGLNSKRKD